MDDSLLERYLRKNKKGYPFSSYTHKGSDVYVKRNTLTTLEPTMPIISKQNIDDVRIPKTKTIFEKQLKQIISKNNGK